MSPWSTREWRSYSSPTALASRRPYLINANIGADTNPGGAGVWELPGLGQSQPAFGGRYQP